MKLPTPARLPEALRGAEAGSFAHFSITVRLPAIGTRVLSENELPLGVQSRMQNLISEIPWGLVRPLDDPGAPDLEYWNRNLQPYLGLNWLQIPWFLAETYFYRRVLEAIGYFQPGVGFARDPYTFQKQQGLEEFQKPIRAACLRLREEIEKISQPGSDRLAHLLLSNLWGNQADLSMWPAGQVDRPDHSEEAGRQHLLCDHSLVAAQYLSSLHPPAQRIDLILDNAGLELVHDLLLADFLLEIDLARTVVLHAKPHPTFVSDAMLKDIQHTLSFLAVSSDPVVSAVSQDIQAHLSVGRLQMSDHFFWTSPLAMWEIPLDLQQYFSSSGLIISKGDANYRRFLGDRHWSFDDPLEFVLSYLPAPWLGLRVSKSEVMVGLQPGLSDNLDSQEKDWLTNGRWGLIQFYEKNIEEKNDPTNISP